MASNSPMQCKSMPTLHKTRLPQELIDTIIGHVRPSTDHPMHRDERQTLKSCALVGRAFRDHSQRLIFYNTCFWPESPDCPSRFRELRDLFFCNGRLASYIRELELYIDDSDDLWLPFFANRNFLACIAQISQNSIGKPLVLVLISDLDDPKDYPSFSPPRNRAFETHFIPLLAPRITKLVVGNMRHVPIALFDNCPNVVELDVEDVTLAPFEESKRVPIDKRPVIRKLWLSRCNDFICNTSLRLNHLSKLKCPGAFQDDLPAVKYALREASTEKLEYLHLEVGLDGVAEDRDRRYSRLGPFDFRMVPNLRRLHLYISFSTPAPSEEDTATDVARFLHSIPLDHNIEFIRLSLHCYGGPCAARPRPLKIEDHFKEANWASLDAVLVKISSGGRRLEVQIGILYDIGDDSEDERPYFAFRFGSPPDFTDAQKDLDFLDHWVPRFLPRASRISNLEINQNPSIGYGRRLRSILNKVEHALFFLGCSF